MSCIVEIYIVGFVITLAFALAIFVPVYFVVSEIVNGGYGRMEAPDVLWAAFILALLWPVTMIVVSVLAPACFIAGIYHTFRWTCRAASAVTSAIARWLKRDRSTTEDPSEAVQ